MEAAIRSAITSAFQDYVVGLEKSDVSQFPVVMRDLTLKPKKVNEELEDTPFVLEQGTVGLIKISPGGLFNMGQVDVEASGIKLTLSFDAYKAAKLAMMPGYSGPDYNTEEIFMTGAYAPRGPPMPPPAANIPPRYCGKHDSSEKRVKREARNCACQSCSITFTSTYAEVELCSMCSDKEKRCIICGAGADKAGSYIPVDQIGKGNGGPPGQQNRENMPPSAPGPGGRNSFAPNGVGAPRTDSMPVLNKNGSQYGAAYGTPPPKTQGQGGPMDRLLTTPRGGPVGAGGPRAPPPQGKGGPPQQLRRPQGKGGPQQPEQDDNPFSAFLRNLNCAVAGIFDNDEECADVRPQQSAYGKGKGKGKGK